MSATTVDEPDRIVTDNNVTMTVADGENLPPKSSDEVLSESDNNQNVMKSQIEVNNSSDNKSQYNIENQKKSNWVQFDDDDGTGKIPTVTPTKEISPRATTSVPIPSARLSVTQALPLSPSTSVDIPPAVLATESVHINYSSTSSSPQKPTANAIATVLNDVQKNSTTQIGTPAPMRTIELSTGRIREGFANGDLIVTLLPINAKWPWITPAVFRPELVPEELMAQGLTLTVEEYVNAMETLVNDYRFTSYNICYKRVLVIWILFAFCVLLALLFSGLQGIALFSLGVGWLFLNAAAIFLCMWVKLRLSRGLEKCLARVNKQFVRHKILLVLDDRGRISCHKVNLCFLYFDPAQCIAYLNEYIERNEQSGTTIESGWEARLDLDVSDIVIQGNNPMRLSRKQAIAREIFLSYLQRWGKDFLRRRLDWTIDEGGISDRPRHLLSSVCPCQYTEEILNNKMKSDSEKTCCGIRDIFKDSR